MLILTRRKGEIITIGDSMHVMVVAIRGDSVRIGVEAPAEVPVHRLEVKLRDDNEANPLPEDWAADHGGDSD